MSEGWAVETDGFEYYPIPGSRLAHAEDRDEYGGPRLPAVPAATYGKRTLKIRYAHPQTGAVLQMFVPAQKHEGGLVPEGLPTGEGWSRSLGRPPGSESIGVLRALKREHLRELWADRGVFPGKQQRVAADGGGERPSDCELCQCSRCGTARDTSTNAVLSG